MVVVVAAAVVVEVVEEVEALDVVEEADTAVSGMVVSPTAVVVGGSVSLAG
jgi:hypothetical protein